jgi:hypothetical protein
MPDPYHSAVHVWPADFVVVHVVIFEFGLFTTRLPASNETGIPDNILELVEGFCDVDPQERAAKIPWSSVAIIGGRADAEILTSPGYFRRDQTLITYQGHIYDRCRALSRRWSHRGDNNITLMLIGLGSRHQYVPPDLQGQVDQRASRESMRFVSSVTRVDTLVPEQVDAVEKNFLQFIADGQKALLAGSHSYNYVPVALDNALFRTLTQHGHPIPALVEPFVMGFLHGWWRGLGFQRLGFWPCEAVRLYGCPGQFNYSLNEGARQANGGIHYSAAVRMGEEHSHATGRCHVSAMDFAGHGDRYRLYGFTIDMLPRHMVSHSFECLS